MLLAAMACESVQAQGEQDYIRDDGSINVQALNEAYFRDSLKFDLFAGCAPVGAFVTASGELTDTDGLQRAMHEAVSVRLAAAGMLATSTTLNLLLVDARLLVNGVLVVEAKFAKRLSDELTGMTRNTSTGVRDAPREGPWERSVLSYGGDVPTILQSVHDMTAEFVSEYQSVNADACQ